MTNLTEEKKALGSEKTDIPEMAKWLAQRCKGDKLSYRQAATKAGVSHATIAAILNGTRPSAATIVKLAKAFSPEGLHQQADLEDYLLSLCGYRISHPEQPPSEPLARLMNKLSHFDEEKLKLVDYFVDFTASFGNGHKPWGDK